jgi:hypothetical protein
MAKWDIKDGFWRLVIEAGAKYIIEVGAKYNFTYVLPQPPGTPTLLVVPTSLQMGWIESPSFFYGASETAWYIAGNYCETRNIFLSYAIGNPAYNNLPECSPEYHTLLNYLLEVYVNLIIRASQASPSHMQWEYDGNS